MTDDKEKNRFWIFQKLDNFAGFGVFLCLVIAVGRYWYLDT